MRRPMAAVSAAAILATAVAALPALASADAPAPQLVVGDKWSATDANVAFTARFHSLVAGPRFGAASTAAATGRAQVALSSGAASLDVPWPLTAGTYDLASTTVGLTRGQVSCTYSSGSLTVTSATTSADGGIGTLSADVTGVCIVPGQSSSSAPAQVAHARIGVPDGIGALPSATPASYGGGAAFGTAVTARITITNDGDQAWTPRVAAVSNSQSATTVFAIADDGCSGAAVAVGATCAVDLSATAPTSTQTVIEDLIVAGDGAADVVVPLVLEAHGDIPAPANVVTRPSRLGAQLTWDAPATQPKAGYRVYDVTGGARTLVATATKDATSVTAPVVGPRSLALVAATGTWSESPDVPITLPADSADVLASSAPTAKAVSASAAGGQPERTLPGASVGGVSPDRTRTLQLDGAGGLSTCRLADDVCVQVPLPATDALRAAWLPDGRIAMLRGWSAPVELWTAQPDGSGLHDVGAGGDWDMLSASADAATVYVRRLSDLSVLRVTLATGLVSAIPGTANVNAFSVGRDGRLALVTFDGNSPPGNTVVTVFQPNGGSPITVPLPPGDNEYAVVDPTGSRIAYSRYADNLHSTVWVANLDGTGAHEVVSAVDEWRSLMWSADDLLSPTAGLSSAAYTAATATITTTASDGDDPSGALTRSCSVDAGDWIPCGPTLQLSGLTAGSHQVQLRVTDPVGHVATAARQWTVDVAAPTMVSTTAVPPVSTAPSLALSWTARDSGPSGLASYDVERLDAPVVGATGVWRLSSALTGLRSRSVSVPLAQGAWTCLRVRARDGAGNVSAWRSAGCTSVVLDDRALSAAGFGRVTGSTDFYRTESDARATGASLSRAVTARRIGVVVATCSSCGAFDVWLGSQRIGHVSTAATATVRRVIWLPLFTTARSGTLRLRTTDSRLVRVDGIVLRR